LLRRVYGEFLEMPGLRLTCRQAQRLWGLDERTCLELLESLVDAKFLCRLAHGVYTRRSDGLATYPQPRTVKARVEDDVSRPKSASGKPKTLEAKVS
jgi:hypothetical protein